MDTYTIDAGGPSRRCHPMEVLKGRRMLGTVERQSDHSTSALGRSPAGLYAQIDVGSVRVLDQRAATDALRRVRLP
jgi:hypothetical protein